MSEEEGEGEERRGWKRGSKRDWEIRKEKERGSGLRDKNFLT